jgi:general secretion pathway protein L
LAPLNLLPAGKRKYESRWTNVPTYALAAAVAALALALGARGPVQDWLYSQHLEREMQALRPQLRELEAAQTDAETAQARLRLLGEARESARAPLALLNELTRILPQEVWLQQFSYDGQTVNITGTAPGASGLLQTLSESPYFENPQFRTSISQTPEGQERFTISARARAAAAGGTSQ